MMREVVYEPILYKTGDVSLDTGILYCQEDIPDTGKWDQSQQACLRNSGLCSHGLGGGSLKEESRRVDERRAACQELEGSFPLDFILCVIVFTGKWAQNLKQ